MADDSSFIASRDSSRSTCGSRLVLGYADDPEVVRALAKLDASMKPTFREPGAWARGIPDNAGMAGWIEDAARAGAWKDDR